MKRSIALAFVVLVTACEKAPPPPPPVAAAPAAPAPEVVAPISTAGLLHPDAAKMNAAGPDSFVVHVVTSKGPFDLKIHRDWAPNGADHFYYLVSNGFYDDVRFFRVLNGFMAQFGVNGDPAINNVWAERALKDDLVKHSNTRGMLAYAAKGSADSRSTQLFINFGSNAQLDGMRFAPFGEVVSGMNVVDSLYGQYGEGAPSGAGPDQTRIGTEGNAYLLKDFPKLDYILTARVNEEWKKK